MNRLSLYSFNVVVLLSAFLAKAYGQPLQSPKLENSALRVNWVHTNEGYQLQRVLVNGQQNWRPLSDVSGQYTVLYSSEQPGMEAQVIKNKNGREVQFPEPEYRYIIPTWKANTSAVSLNKEGRSVSFYPQQCKADGNGLVFTQNTDVADIEASWKLDPLHTHDLRVTIQLTARAAGYYSIATPALTVNDKKKFGWAIIPGIFQGNSINNNFIDAYAYGHGIPGQPVVVRERTASALTSILTNKEGVTLAVTAEPGAARHPWLSDKSTQSEWLLGLSMINRNQQLTPTLYHPVLGQKNHS
ncbi:hypothetical protein [Niabella hibiscisoli]|uniref:hypothetical protein n=1 Tax=Niabella hibiscisoli TaxID=1825928 RepID=UPI001F113EBD|nr:hypothetical protein [Niabella hibiscisoli]MCH5719494.1 hypothetical protein [Niabella hibiscisoli]